MVAQLPNRGGGGGPTLPSARRARSPSCMLDETQPKRACTAHPLHPQARRLRRPASASPPGTPPPTQRRRLILTLDRSEEQWRGTLVLPPPPVAPGRRRTPTPAPRQADPDEEEEEPELAQLHTSPASTSRPDSRGSSPPSTYTCPLCLSLLVKPVTLECGSSLCESCVAQALHHAWAVEGRRTAPCPVLGRSCIPLARLPRLNALLHNELLETFPQRYQERLTEVETPAIKDLVAAVQNRTTRLVHRCIQHQSGGPGRRQQDFSRPLRDGQEVDERRRRQVLALEDEEEDEEDDEDDDQRRARRKVLESLVHLRFALPFLMAIVASLLYVPARGPFSSLGGNGFALLLTSSMGSHWVLWSLVASMLAADKGRIPTPATATFFARQQAELLGFRHLPQDLVMRFRLAGDFAPGLGLCCTWMLLSSASEIGITWCRLTAVRARIQSQQSHAGGRNSTWWLLATEVLVFIGALLWYELISLASYQLLQVVLGNLSLGMLANKRVHNLYCVFWYVGVFARIILGPFMPRRSLRRHVRKLQALQGLPPWRAILLDPRISILHCHSGLEVRALSDLLSWARQKAFHARFWSALDGTQVLEEEEAEEMETPRAPRATREEEDVGSNAQPRVPSRGAAATVEAH